MAGVSKHRRTRTAEIVRALVGFAVLVAAIGTGTAALTACTVFISFDGQVALAGQNEDWDDFNTQWWTVPATRTTHGVLYFGFGRGDYPPGGIRLSATVKRLLRGENIRPEEVKADDLYGLPQQGINDAGLFFGGAETASVKQTKRSRLPRFEGHIIDFIMRNCATVDEALRVLNGADYPMPSGQLLFGDASGRSFILEAGHVVIPGTTRQQVMTNFLQSREPEKKATDRRYVTASERLQREPTFAERDAVDLLKAVQQSNTRYSLVVNLTNATVLVFRSRKFDESAELNVRNEIAKGPRAGRISDLFRHPGS